MKEETPCPEENLYTFENEAHRKTYWHTCSHVMAQAVKRLYPQVKLAIGPSIDSGWYYDFDADFSFHADNLDAIEAEMKKICKEKLPLVRSEKLRVEAVAYMESLGEPYKVELINDLPRMPSSRSTQASSRICAQARIWTTPAASRQTPSS